MGQEMQWQEKYTALREEQERMLDQMGLRSLEEMAEKVLRLEKQY